MELRDIRQDLFDRLEALDERHRAEMSALDEQLEALHRNHQQAVALIEKERVALLQMLAVEDVRNGGSTLSAPPTRVLATLPEFITTRVHALGPIAKDDLRTEVVAAGYLNEATGRTFHLTLMNLKKHGKVMQLGDGRYVFPQSPESRSEAGQEVEEAESTERVVLTGNQFPDEQGA